LRRDIKSHLNEPTRSVDDRILIDHRRRTSDGQNKRWKAFCPAPECGDLYAECPVSRSPRRVGGRRARGERRRARRRGAPSPSSSPSLDADPSAATPSVINPSTVNPSIVEQIDEPFDPNTATRIRIEPTSDGDAQWTVSVRYALSDERDRAAFDSVGERFRDGEVGPDATLFEGFARQASQNLDRTMRIENVDREVVTHDDPSSFDVASAETAAVGELRLTFVWTEFLEEDGENLVLGDALTTSDGGTWLLSLEDRQTLEVATPEGYSVTGTPSTAVAQLSDGDVIIEGPQTFEGGDPVVIVYGPASTIAPPWTMLTAAIVIAAVLIAGSIVGYRRMDGSPGSAASGSVDEATVDSGGENAPTTDGSTP